MIRVWIEDNKRDNERDPDNYDLYKIFIFYKSYRNIFYNNYSLNEHKSVTSIARQSMRLND